MRIFTFLLIFFVSLPAILLADVGGMLFDRNSRFTYLHYFISLLLTLVLESVVGLSYLTYWNLPKNNLKDIVYCSLLTHPIFWIIGEQMNWNGNFIIWGEAIIISVEAILLSTVFKIRMPIEYLILLSLVMNLVSAIVGGLIYSVLTIFV